MSWPYDLGRAGARLAQCTAERTGRNHTRGTGDAKALFTGEIGTAAIGDRSKPLRLCHHGVVSFDSSGLPTMTARARNTTANPRGTWTQPDGIAAPNARMAHTKISAMPTNTERFAFMGL